MPDLQHVASCGFHFWTYTACVFHRQIHFDLKDRCTHCIYRLKHIRGKASPWTHDFHSFSNHVYFQMVWRRCKGKGTGHPNHPALCAEAAARVRHPSGLRDYIPGLLKTPRSHSCWTIQELWCISANLWKAKAGKLWVWGQAGLYAETLLCCEFLASLTHMWSCVKEWEHFAHSSLPALSTADCTVRGQWHKTEQGLTTSNFWGCKQAFTMEFTFLRIPYEIIEILTLDDLLNV